MTTESSPVLIAVTRLRVRSTWFLPIFFLQTLRIAMQTKAAEGNLGMSVLADAHRTFWTRSAWVDEASMRRYMVAGVHGRAMRKLAEWCDEASVAQWQQESPRLPAWREVYRRMVETGRPSRVRHPSPAQQAFQVEPMRLRRSSGSRP